LTWAIDRKVELVYREVLYMPNILNELMYGKADVGEADVDRRWGRGSKMNHTRKTP
jgi:hypothetical protein